jgi:outer membrane biosynthesis protein TonB
MTIHSRLDTPASHLTLSIASTAPGVSSQIYKKMRTSVLVHLLAAIASIANVAGLPVDSELVEKDVVVVVKTITVAVTKFAGQPEMTGAPPPQYAAAMESGDGRWGDQGGGKGWGRGKGYHGQQEQQSQQPPPPAQPTEPEPTALVAPQPKPVESQSAEVRPQPAQSETAEARPASPSTTAEAPPAEPSPKPPAEPAAQTTPPSGDDDKILAAHNNYRAVCPGAAKMSWDAEVRNSSI